LHLAPGIGKVALARLTPAQLDTWFREHQEHGASPRAIRYARSVLRAALNQARKWGAVSQNVAELVDAPRHQAREIQPLTPEQARALLEAARGHRLGGVISVATALGLRLGEALGLRWADVDFDAGTLRVKQALERSGGDSAARRPLIVERRELRKHIEAAPKRSAERRELRVRLEALHVRWRTVRTTLKTTEPKSMRSRRLIRMPAVVVAALKAHRTRQLEDRLAAGGAWHDSGFVFTSPIGTALEPRNVTRKFHVLLAGAGLPSVRFHDLRHTAATLLLAQGVDPRTIMETLGHSQISLTLNTYSHVLPALQEDAAAKLDAILTR
jgi:integrase